MLKKTLLSLALLGAGALGLAAVPGPALAGQTQATAVIEPAGVSIGVRVWDRYRDGPRCYRRYGGCNYYYQGWWYARPWWRVAPPPRYGYGYLPPSPPPVYYDEAPPPYPGYSYDGPTPGGSRHVEWCLQRYRSYNPRTNTWVSYDGEIRRCVSPYSY